MVSQIVQNGSKKGKRVFKKIPKWSDMVEIHLKLFHKVTTFGVTAFGVTAVRNNLKFLTIITIGSTIILS